MPVREVSFEAAERFASPLQQMTHEAISIATRGDPLAIHPAPEKLGWVPAAKAFLGTSIAHNLGTSLSRPLSEPASDFNPFQFIKDTPSLRDDPMVNHLVDRGQFDHSLDRRQFFYDLQVGLDFMDDIQALQNAAWTQYMAYFAYGLVSDPTVIVPGGIALKFGKTAVAAKNITKLGAMMRVGGVATGAGAANVAIEKFQQSMMPAAGEDGINDEIVAFAMGAGLAGTLTVAMHPLVGGAIMKGFDHRATKKLQRRSIQMMQDPIVRPLDPQTMEVNPTGLHVSVPDELARNGRYLDSVLEEPAIGPTNISSLTSRHISDGIENKKKLGRIIAMYEDEGVEVHVTPHPDQKLMDALDDVQDVLNHPTINNTATNAQINQSLVSRLFGAVSSRYAGVQALATPGGRLGQTMYGGFQDVYRTLSGSASTITEGSALKPMTNLVGPSAEGLRGIYEGVKDKLLLSIRLSYRRIKEPFMHEGRRVEARNDYGNFRVMAGQEMRRQQTRAKGFAVPDPPADMHPELKGIVRDTRRVFNMFYEDMEVEGMMHIGPRRLKEVQGELEQLEGDLKAATANAEKLGRTTKRQLEAEELVRRKKDELETVSRVVEEMKHYFPMAWKVPAMEQAPDRWKRMMADNFRENDGIVKGVTISDEQRRLINGAIENLKESEQEQIRQLAAQKLGVEIPEDFDPLFVAETLTEGELPGTLKTVYLKELDEFYLRNADSAYNTIVNPNEMHGVMDGYGLDPIKERVMRTNEVNMSEFLVHDIEEIIERYFRVVGGRIAIRKAIRLNPQIWGNVIIGEGKNARPVKDGNDLLAYLDERHAALNNFAQIAAERTGDGELLTIAKRLRKRIDSDFGVPLRVMQGRSPFGAGHDPFDGFGFWGRISLHFQFLNKLGSIAVAMMNDTFPQLMAAAQSPRSIARIPKIIAGLDKFTRRELEVMGLGFDGLVRVRNLADVDHQITGLGYGAGVTRELSSRFENVVGRMGDFQAKISMLNWINDKQKIVAGMLTLDKVMSQSKRLLKAQALMAAEGIDEATALRRAGLPTRFEVARLNKLGWNLQRSRRFHELTYRHGLDTNDDNIRDVMSFEQYMDSRAVFKPNFEEWGDNMPQGDRDLLSTIAGNINDEVNRHIVVTPGIFDRPLINYHALGRLFNQLQGFLIAFVNQRLAPMAQMPAKYQMWNIMGYLGFGAISDGIGNQLAQRRNINETVGLWGSNPLGMMYQAFNRSGLLGITSRYLSALDALNIPIAPGVMFDNTVGSAAAAHVPPGRFLTVFGPIVTDVDRLARTTADIASGRWDRITAYNLGKLAPYNNFIGLRAAQLGAEAVGLPLTLTPESIRGANQGVRREPPRP